MKNNLFNLVVLAVLLCCHLTVSTQQLSASSHLTLLENNFDSNLSLVGTENQNYLKLNNNKSEIRQDRIFLEKMFFGAGVVFSKKDSLYFLESGFINFKAPLWTIKEEGLSRHLILGTIDLYIMAKSKSYDMELVYVEYSTWTETDANLFETIKTELFEQESVLSIGSIGFSYNFGIPVKNKILHEGKLVDGKKILDFNIGVGLNISHLMVSEFAIQNSLQYSSASLESVLIGRTQSSITTGFGKSSLIADGLYFRLGLPLFLNFGVELGVNHLFFGRSQHTFQIGLTYSPG
jgi:hypothetical protein